MTPEERKAGEMKLLLFGVAAVVALIFAWPVGVSLGLYTIYLLLKDA